MQFIKFVVAIAVLALCTALPVSAADAVKTVYHLNDGRPQAQRALNNIQNHLQADATAQIVVVAHGGGIDFLIEGAESADGSAFAGPVDELAAKGVKFLVCNNTLTQRKIAREKVSRRATIIGSGVAEIARLQAQERFAYLRP